MHNSIDIFHNEEKISTSYDDIFYKKENNKWVEIKNKNVFKGIDNPDSSIGKNGDYYIQYEKIKNYINSSENFLGTNWINCNCIISPDLIKFPYTECSKIIPNEIYSEHSLSYNFNNSELIEKPYWCFSLYVMPAEFNYFQMILSDEFNEVGVIATFSKVFDARKKIVINKKIESFGDETKIEYDNDCFNITLLKDGVYRVFVSAKFLENMNLQCKFRILKNDKGLLQEEYSNDNDTCGLFINGAQLSKNKFPDEYVYSDESNSVYYKLKNIYEKENNIWNILPDYVKIYYSDDKPENNIGQNGDIYFVNPFITLSPRVRFGDNPTFRCWKLENTTPEENNILYTSKVEPDVGDELYEYKSNKMIFSGKTVYDYDINTNSIKVENSVENTITAYIDYSLSTSTTYCWRYNDEYCYTDRKDLTTGDFIYSDINKTNKISTVITFNKDDEVVDLSNWEYERKNNTLYVTRYRGNENDIILPYMSGDPEMTITFMINFLIYKRYNNGDRKLIILNEEGIIFHNKDKGTYSYIGKDKKQYNILFNGKSLYNFILINDAIAFSTNLFNQTYTAKYTTNFPKIEFGYNSGGHGNFWDYNKLRRYY